MNLLLSSGLGKSGLVCCSKAAPTASIGEWQVAVSRLIAVSPVVLIPTYCVPAFSSKWLLPRGLCPARCNPIGAAKGQLCFLVWFFYPAASWPSFGQDRDGDFTSTGGNSLFWRGLGYNQIFLSLEAYCHINLN